jgi:2-phosphoglycerate kinase
MKMAGEQDTVRGVYWIGGGSGAGKSTIARRLADRHGLRVYSTDDVMADHAARTTPAEAPMLHRFAAMDMDERWLHRSPQTMLETFHWYRGEGFHLIVEDLSTGHEGVIVEGFRLLPRLVQPYLTDTSHAVWLLPTPEFRRAAFENRGGLWKIAGRTSDPERALQNLLERDRMFTDRLRDETAELRQYTIEIESGMTEEALASRVARHFRLVS